MYIANLTETHILTRQDNWVVFRCSSQNQYTKEPALAKDIGPMEVLYGTTNATIEASDLNFSIDDIVTLNAYLTGIQKQTIYGNLITQKLVETPSTTFLSIKCLSSYLLLSQTSVTVGTTSVWHQTTSKDNDLTALLMSN